MEVSRVKNGNRHRDILVIGKTTVKMASVFSFIKTEINTKECGVKTIDTVKEHTGEMKQEN
jgi:t-SNARE complex subunit (syntaxin)